MPTSSAEHIVVEPVNYGLQIELVMFSFGNP